MNVPSQLLLCTCGLVTILILTQTLTKQQDITIPLQNYLLPQFRQFPASLTCNTTIVSAYYKIKSKHSYEEYLSWMVNFLSLRDCMVIFIQPDLKETILTLRPPLPSLPNTHHPQAIGIIPGG